MQWGEFQATVKYRSEGPQQHEPTPFVIFPKEARDQIDISLRIFTEKAIPDPSKVEVFLRAQAETEILPPFESALIESIGVESFQEFVSYGEKLLQSGTQIEARSITQPEFFSMLRGSVTNRYRSLRKQVISWLCLKAFIVGGYGPLSNLNILTWAKAERRSLKIPVRTPCPICSTEGTLVLHSVDRLYSLDAEFRCSRCMHCFRTPNDEVSSLSNAETNCKEELCCFCDFCTESKGEILETIRSVVARIKDRKLMEYKAWRIGLPNPYISRQMMFRDHQLNKNNIGKNLRLVLSLRPQTGDDFMSCIEAYQGENRDAGGKIRAEAIKNKVIYEEFQYHAQDYEGFDRLLADSFATSISNVLWPERSCWSRTYQMDLDQLIEAKRQAFENIVLPLLNDSNAYLNLRALPPYIYFAFETHWILLHGPDIQRPSSQSVSGSEKVNYHSSLLNARIYPDATRRLTLNMAFLECTEQHKPTGNPSHRRLFNSNIEQNAYHRLVTNLEDTEYIVIPNRIFYQLLTREALHKLEESYYRERPSDWQYVRTCELDLVIYDREGDLIAVEEVQRGDHHNQTEWIRKDALKREALGLAGIPFRESF